MTDANEPGEAERERFRRVLEALWGAHGRVEQEGDDDILGVLVRTVLSQSTTKSNTDRAFSGLLERFGGEWALVASAEVEAVVESIEVGGLARQKAPRIQAIVKRAREDGPDDDYSLEFVRDWPVDEALDYLENLRGVGPKTARFTMMYAGGADLFPIDTHIFRIMERLGLLDPSLSSSRAHRRAEEMVPEGEAYPAHMVLVQHGREVCSARRPRCEACSARELCPREGLETSK